MKQNLMNGEQNSLEKMMMGLHEKIDKVLKGGFKEWLDNSDVMRKLKISARTLQMYRDKGLLPFYKKLGKIWYKLNEVDAFVESGASHPKGFKQ